MTGTSRRRVLALLGTGAFGRSALRPRGGARAETFGAWLTGENEIPPVETDGFGVAGFRLAPDERRVDYRLVVAGVENVEQSHIHKGPPDLNGNVVAYLFGPVRDPVTRTGLLAAGTLTDEDVIWPLTDAAELADQFRAENVYVNVHTTGHPAGEIRGQIRSLTG